MEAIQAVRPAVIRRVLSRGDVRDWTDAVDWSWRTGRRPTIRAATGTGLVAVRRYSYRGERCIGWNMARELLERSPELLEACGVRRLPSLHACERFERKHRVALDDLLGPAERAVQEWTHGAIIRAIREWQTVYGTWPTANEWNPAAISNERIRDIAERRYRGHGFPSVRAVQVAFGSWSAAMRAAQQPVSAGSRRAYRDTIAEHEKQAARAEWATAERPAGSKSPSFTRSLDAPLGDEGATLHDLLAAQGALEDDE